VVRFTLSDLALGEIVSDVCWLGGCLDMVAETEVSAGAWNLIPVIQPVACQFTHE